MDTCEKLNVIDIWQLKLLEQYYTEMSRKGLSVKKRKLMSSIFEKNTENKPYFYKVIHIPFRLQSMKKEFTEQGWEPLFMIDDSTYIFKSDKRIEPLDNIENKLMRLFKKKIVINSIIAEILLGIAIALMLLAPHTPLNYVLISVLALEALYILVHALLALGIFRQTLETHIKIQIMLWYLVVVFFGLVYVTMIMF